ncbi:hypothetical protein Tco_0786122 [Tanacetum coccineum]
MLLSQLSYISTYTPRFIKSINTTGALVKPKGITMNSNVHNDPTGKDNVIVSAGRSKVIPAGRTILVLVVLCLLRVDSIVSNIAVQRETKQEQIASVSSGTLADFHILSCKGIWLAVKAVWEILSHNNQMQAKPDNEDCNMKFLRALLPSWSQVAITLKTKGGLDYLSFDDLYNKLRTLEIDVKGGSSYDSEVLLSYHSAFISAASTNSKMSYADSQNQSPSITFTTASSSADASSNSGKFGFEEWTSKWQNGNAFWNAARFDKKKVKCISVQRWVTLLGMCRKLLDSKSKTMKVKMRKKGSAQVYGMIAGDDDDVAGDASGDVFDDAADLRLWDLEKLLDQMRFVKAVGMHVPSPITGTFMPPSNKPDLDDTQVTYGSNDKSSDSETTGFASCISSVKSSSSKNNEHLASASSSVDFKTVSKTADQKPSSTIDDPSFSFKENVKTPRNISAYVPVVVEFHLRFVSVGSAFPAGSRNRPASVSAGRPFSAGWRNHAARPMTRPTSHYFQHFRRPGCL